MWIKFRKKTLPFYYGEKAAVGKYGTGSVYEWIKKEAIKHGSKIQIPKGNWK